MKDVKNAINHLRTHQDYPATKEQLVAACNNLDDFSEQDKKWFEEHLPQGTYESADQVMQALGLNTQQMNA